MSEEVKYSVWLQGSDGKNYVIPYEGLKQKLGICNLLTDFKGLDSEITKIRDFIIEKLLTPEMEEKIVEIIKDNPDIQTRNLNSKMPWQEWGRLAWCLAFDRLKESNRILGTSHGRGQNRTWRLNEKMEV